MRNLPEGAGSPISRMPQKTKGGLCPTHQPTFSVSSCEWLLSTASSFWLFLLLIFGFSLFFGFAAVVAVAQFVYALLVFFFRTVQKETVFSLSLSKFGKN
jgi:hypothetical protein